MIKGLAELERITGHKFLNPVALECALTHVSAENDPARNYERLEFLGDRVLGLVITEMLCTLFPKASEGELSVRLNSLVNAKFCAQIAQEMHLHKFIKMGAEMQNLEGRRLYNIYADVVEALIAVIYLDNGLEGVKNFVARFWRDKAEKIEGGRRDAKTSLQEWSHQKNGSSPVYKVLSRVGPDHAPCFEVEVYVSGYCAVCAKGASKREAERKAAEKLLKEIGVWNDG